MRNSGIGISVVEQAPKADADARRVAGVIDADGGHATPAADAPGTVGTGDHNTAANWTPATVPNGTATFGLSAQNAVTLLVPNTVGGWTFGSAAPAYTFDVKTI